MSKKDLLVKAALAGVLVGLSSCGTADRNNPKGKCYFERAGCGGRKTCNGKTRIGKKCGSSCGSKMKGKSCGSKGCGSKGCGSKGPDYKMMHKRDCERKGGTFAPMDQE